MEHAYRKGGMTGSTWNAYEGRMTTPLLRCAPLATLRGRCHGIHEEHMRRGAGSGSPLSFWLRNPRPLSQAGQHLPFVQIPLVANAHPF
jgi:hypothetical protein